MTWLSWGSVLGPGGVFSVLGGCLYVLLWLVYVLLVTVVRIVLGGSTELLLVRVAGAAIVNERVLQRSLGRLIQLVVELCLRVRVLVV